MRSRAQPSASPSRLRRAHRIGTIEHASAGPNAVRLTFRQMVCSSYGDAAPSALRAPGSIEHLAGSNLCLLLAKTIWSWTSIAEREAILSCPRGWTPKHPNLSACSVPMRGRALGSLTCADTPFVCLVDARSATPTADIPARTTTADTKPARSRPAHGRRLFPQRAPICGPRHPAAGRRLGASRVDDRSGSRRHVATPPPDSPRR